MKILIDADGCPVVEEAALIAEKFGLECVVFCDTAHIIQSEYAQVRVVEKGPDSVDFALAATAQKGDIAVTQDYGLAAMCLSKGAMAINQNGTVYDADNIDAMLYSRYITKKIKKAGGRVKGPKKRDKSRDTQFCKALENMIKAAV